MNDSPQKPDPQIQRFKNEIRRKWNCDATLIGRERIDLPCVPPGRFVSIFKLPVPPDENPMAEQCFAWESKHVKPNQIGNEEIVVLDVQVPSEDLPHMAVWAWLTNALVNDKEADFVKSQKLSKGELRGLHNQPVNFVSNEKKKDGWFFVRERKDGKCSVRIVHKVLIPFDGKKEDKLDSFCLTQKQIESIESPGDDSDDSGIFRVTL